MVPDQLSLPSERSTGVEEPPAPPAVIPPARRSYAKAAAFSPLEGADWVYVESGEAAKPCTGGQVQRPLQGAGAQQQGMEGPGYNTRN